MAEEVRRIPNRWWKVLSNQSLLISRPRIVLARRHALLVVGIIACTSRPSATRTYQARRDEYRQTLLIRQKRGEDISTANDSALRQLETLLRPVVGNFNTPWIVGRGRINLQTLLPGEVDSGLPDGMLYRSRDSSIHVLVTTQDLLRSWIAWFFEGDSTVPRDPVLALDNEDVLTQIFDADAHVYPYTDIPVDGAPLGIISATLVTRSQDYAPSPADELIISVARGARIFIIDTPAHDTLAIPPTCRAAADSAMVRSKALVESATNSRFRACYGESVVHEARFQGLVAQVRRLVESLPAH